MAKIIGGTATSSMLVPDWNQTNPNRADYIKNKPDVANALKGSAEGNPIRLDGVSPVKHEIAVGLRSKNICPTQEYGVQTPLFIPKGTTITASSGNATADAMQVLFYDENKKRIENDSVSLFYSTTDGRSYGTKTLSQDAHYMMWAWANVNNVIDGQIEIGTTATSYTPYMDFTKDYIKGEFVTDSNWSHPSYFSYTTETFVQVTATDTSNEKITFSNGDVWRGSGNLTSSVQGNLAEVFSVGDWACIVPGDYELLLHKATKVEKTVQRYGKNIFDYVSLYSSVSGVTITNGEVRGEGWRLLGGKYTFPSCFVGKTITASALMKGVATTNSNHEMHIRVYNDNKSKETLSNYIHTNGADFEKAIITKTIEDGDYLQVSYSSGSGETIVFKDFQIEIGTTAAEYEPYKCETYTADENGNVEGIIGNGEAMTLIADSGAIISAEYNKDTNKVIESLVNAIISLGGNV